MNKNSGYLALFISNLTSRGGVSRTMLTLAHALAVRGYKVDVVVVAPRGPLRSAVSPLVRLVELTDWQTRLPWILQKRHGQDLASAVPLARYLRREQPDILLSAGSYVNFSAVLARTRISGSTRVVISQRSHLSAEVTHRARRGRSLFLRWLARRFYPWADAITAVSDSVADDLARVLQLPRQRITAVHNPVVSLELEQKAHMRLSHPWFAPDSPPVVLGVGRITLQKDFPTLVKAFSRLRATRAARLIILGEAKKASNRTKLMALATQLGIADDVALPGFVENPFAYMARSALFVLSSLWEGLPAVLIQAMACGCPVLSTNCPGGPAEILQGGVYGPLVPIGDDAALAKAMDAVLDNPPDKHSLQVRAAQFSVDASVKRYLEVFRGIR